MGYSLPHETAHGGSFTPLRFEATGQGCIVSQGEMPNTLAHRHHGVGGGATWKRPTE
jgi:hypothetical protein